MRCALIVLGLALFACDSIASAIPLTVGEVSLMLRSGYSSDAVMHELATRKFAGTLDSASETELVRAGAQESLISALRSSVNQLSPAELAAWEQRKQSLHSAEAPQPVANAPRVRPGPAGQSQVRGSIYDCFKDDLVYWHEGSLVPFDDEGLQSKKLYLLFFSAIWSKEGRHFTTQLVDYYNRVGPQHPEFEVIFFSLDRSQFAMQNYVSQTNMPWPAVAYDKSDGKSGPIRQRLARPMARLVLIDATGNVLSDSGETQGNFDKVLSDLDRALTATK